MKEAFTEPIVPAYRTENEELFLGDTFELLSEMRPESVDMVFADPPYFLSNDGVIYFLDEKQYGVMRWTIKSDMVTDTLDMIDEHYPNYGAGEPIDVTFPDGTEVHVTAE